MATPAAPTATILLVEDDAFLVGMYVAKFDMERMVTLVASDGEQGLMLAREKLPDLILLDVLLPNMDGFQVLTELKNDPATRTIPVVLLTNMGQKQDVERGMALGAADYLIKAHYMPSEVVDRIKQILEHATPSAGWQ